MAAVEALKTNGGRGMGGNTMLNCKILQHRSTLPEKDGNSGGSIERPSPKTGKGGIGISIQAISQVYWCTHDTAVR